MLVGTTLNEVATNIGHPDGEAMTNAQLLAQVHEMVGERAADVVAVFRERTPKGEAIRSVVSHRIRARAWGCH